jgi:hypothetical protein
MVVLSGSHMTNWFGTVMRLAHSDPGIFFGIPWMRTNISRLWPGVTTETEQKPTWESQQESIYPSYPPVIKHGLREHLGRWRSMILPLKPPFTGFLHCHVWLSKGTIPGLVTTCPNKGIPISSTRGLGFTIHIRLDRLVPWQIRKRPAITILAHASRKRKPQRRKSSDQKTLSS